MKLLFTTIFIFVLSTIQSQSIFFQSNSFISLTDNAVVYVQDTAINSIQSNGGGFFINDTLDGYVEWNIENNVGVYEVPFISHFNTYLPVKLHLTSPGVGSSIKISSTDTAINSSTSYYDTSNIEKYWLIDLSNYSTFPSGTISLYYDTALVNSTYSDLGAVYYNGSNWNSIVSVPQVNHVTFSIDAYNNNTRWSIAPTPNILPVTLLYFNGEVLENSYAHLTWATAIEINNDGFFIEKSTDMNTFNSIGWVSGNGNSTQLNSYSYDDVMLPDVVTYYRLKQMDFDGQYNYSNVVALKINSTKLAVRYYTITGQQVHMDSQIASGVYVKVSYDAITNETVSKLIGIVN